jgi:hypothetical protein
MRANPKLVLYKKKEALLDKKRLLSVRAHQKLALIQKEGCISLDKRKRFLSVIANPKLALFTMKAHLIG